MSSDNNRRLQTLRGSDFEMADGQPNIRGWDVLDETGQRIGEVEEIIFDVQSRKVRYIVLDLEGNLMDLDARNVLIPIGLVELHDEDDNLLLRNISADQLRRLPDYDADVLDDDTETKTRSVFDTSYTGVTGVGGTTAASGEWDSFYEHEYYNDRKLYRNRPNNQ
jgi:hypothetical protein